MKSKLLAVAASVLLASALSAPANATTYQLDVFGTTSTSVYLCGTIGSSCGTVTTEQFAGGYHVAIETHTPDNAFGFSLSSVFMQVEGPFSLTLPTSWWRAWNWSTDPVHTPLGSFVGELTCLPSSPDSCGFAHWINFDILTSGELLGNEAGIVFAVLLANGASGPTPDYIGAQYVAPPLVTPLPAALPLFATGLGALGLLGWRRKRKAVAA